MKKYKHTKFFTIDGKRYAVRADTPEELAVKEYKKRQEIEEGTNRVDSSMLLKDWAVQCVETFKTNQSDITRQKYVSRMKYSILKPIGNMRLKDIKLIHCQRVLNEQAGKSKRHINEIYQMMQFLFGKAVANGLLKSNPAEHVVKPAGSVGHRRALASSERRYFIEIGLQDRRYYYYMLMLFCGCRPVEAAGAMGKDIKMLPNGLPALHIRGTKTKNADRTVPIPLEFYEVIQDIPADEFIAVTESGGPISHTNRTRIWNSFTRQINIAMGCKTYRNALVPPFPLAPDLVPYCLRHEYCTDLARRGVDIRIAQKLMGHSDIQLTANIYTNLNNDDISNVAEVLASGVAPGVAEKGSKSNKNLHLKAVEK